MNTYKYVVSGYGVYKYENRDTNTANTSVCCT